MGNNFNNSNKPANNNCAKNDKVVKDMAKEISKASEALGVQAEDIIMGLIAELRLNMNMTIGDIKADVPLFSGNTFNISIGDVTVADRGGKIKNKKGGKKKNKK